ncbi:MAG: TlpA family protein disulfide reductase [Sediminibacterium sp.]|nr:TlpA family protein disulfide reductase [Sediminibacterium sp.]
MRKLLLLPIVLLCYFAEAQNVKIHATIKNFPNASVSLLRPIKGFRYDYFKEGAIEPKIKDGAFDVTLTIDDPEIVSLRFYDTINNEMRVQNMFLKKGYDLTLGFTYDDGKMLLETKGTGAADNQYLPVSPYRNFDVFYKAKDTLPAAAYAYLLEEQRRDSATIAEYNKKNKPSAEFREAWKYQLKYQVLSDYHGFSENHKFSIQEAYERNLSAWRGLQDRLFSQANLSEDKALVSPYYQKLLKNYIFRTKERLWMEAAKNKTAFLAKWYGDDSIQAFKEYREDVENRLCQKIIDKTLTGKAKEYAYAVIFENAIHSSLLTNMPSIYADFKDAYPNSKFRVRFEPEFTAMFDRAKHPLTDKMVFIPEGNKINTWQTVLAQLKGKTVLLDMWGTWCGPCREEMDKNSAAIKEHFKNKGLDYLYIANRDEGQEKKWKDLIAYFNLEGYHILANSNLNKDIMDTIKGEGYPTYAIIRRDGSVELSRAGYPMNRQVLIGQIENALK